MLSLGVWRLVRTCNVLQTNEAIASGLYMRHSLPPANKTAGSSDEHVYPDPDGFVVDTPMGRYTGVKEMIEMSKTPDEYKHPLTPLDSWQPSGSSRREAQLISKRTA